MKSKPNLDRGKRDWRESNVEIQKNLILPLLTGIQSSPTPVSHPNVESKNFETSPMWRSIFQSPILRSLITTHVWKSGSKTDSFYKREKLHLLSIFYAFFLGPVISPILVFSLLQEKIAARKWDAPGQKIGGKI